MWSATPLRTAMLFTMRLAALIVMLAILGEGRRESRDKADDRG